jgi:hypothetical protein
MPLPITNPAKKQRATNFELLRIVAMVMIVAHHFLIATGSVDYSNSSPCGGEAANAFLVCGVNCFVLISGYFGIRTTPKRFAKFLFTILFVAAAEVLFSSVTGLAQYFNINYAIHKIIPVFRDSNWFIPSYIGLMAIAPVLNKAIANATLKESAIWTAILTALEIYAYIFSVTSISSTGYNMMHFIYLYILGDFLKRASSRVKTTAAAAAYIAGCLAALITAKFIGTGYTAFAYNSPQIMIASAGLFLLFSKMRIKSAAINLVASGTFCVFLFHYSIIYNLKSHRSFIAIALVFLASFVIGTALSKACNATWNLVKKTTARNKA